VSARLARPVLARAVLAEVVGTGTLVAAVVGSGIAAARFSPQDLGLQLLENSIATGAALTALILALQGISASFNPVVTLAQVASGAVDRLDGLTLVVAQLVGGVVGCGTANLMFGLDVVARSAHRRTGSGLWLGEVVATAGLVVVIFGCQRSGHVDRVAYAVGGYIAAAYWFTSSTSFANPAVTVARMFSDTFSGIAPSSVAPFVAMQLVGGAVGWGIVRALYPVAHPVATTAASAVREGTP
jgi:glycerol uptake facilitator-like aquaporin